MALVSSIELARFLDLESKRRVEQLVHEGMPRAGPGKYDVGACMAWYIRFQKKIIRGGSGGDGAAASIRDERARGLRAENALKEMEVAKRRGELIGVDEAVSLWEGAIERMRAKMIASVNVSAPKIVGIKTVAQAHAALEGIVYEALAASAQIGDEVEGVNGNGNGTGGSKKSRSN